MDKDVTSVTKSLDRIADALEGGGSGGDYDSSTIEELKQNMIIRYSDRWSDNYWYSIPSGE